MTTTIKAALSALPLKATIAGTLNVSVENGSHSSFSIFMHDGAFRYQCHVSRSYNGPEGAERTADVVRQACSVADAFVAALNSALKAEAYP